MTEVRHDFSNVANRVIFGGERIYIKKNGKAALAMVPIADVEALEVLEDRLDIEAAKEAIKQGNFVDLDELIKQLKL
jgi:hypothetical protein